MSDKPICKLIGEDGNVFNLLAMVSKTLRVAGRSEQATELNERITTCGSYDEALRLFMEYVEIE